MHALYYIEILKYGKSQLLQEINVDTDGSIRNAGDAPFSAKDTIFPASLLSLF